MEHSVSVDTFLEAENVYITSHPVQGGMASNNSL